MAGRDGAWRASFFFNGTATTESYTLSLHDALPICGRGPRPSTRDHDRPCSPPPSGEGDRGTRWRGCRSEEHTSELQSQFHLVCRLLLEKKNVTTVKPTPPFTPYPPGAY